MDKSRKYKPWRTIGPDEVEAAREIFFKHGPGNLSLIVREMRDSGWREFHLADLEGRPRRDFAGLVSEYGWRDEWRRIHAPEPTAEPETAAVAKVTENPPEKRSDSKADHFPAWLEATRPNWKWRLKFQTEIYKQLARITSGRLNRLMIFMPPRHGKSELVTIRYAAWRLLCDPTLRIVVASYNQRLANRFSRQIKAVYRSVPDVNPSTHDDEERLLVLNTAEEWETPEGGGVKAIGAGSGITGFGADLIIIDDPIRSRADAESKNNRDRIWDWFTDDLMTRLEPNGAVILIQTRWHEKDLAGRLLAKQEQQVQGSKFKVPSRGGNQVQGSKFKVPGPGRKSYKSSTLNFEPETLNSNGPETLNSTPWSVVRLPAIAEAGNAGALACNAGSSGVTVRGTSQTEESQASSASQKRTLAGGGARVPRDPLGRKPGQALWPERFPVHKLLERKAEMGSYSFSALYQQSPMPADGALFKREYFGRIVPFAPAGLQWFRGYDLAVSTKTSADYTASFRVALDKKTGDLYIADGFRGRLEFPDQRKYIVGRIRDERNTEHGIEQALHGQAFVQDLWREEHLSSSAFRGVRVTVDKYTRALARANRAEAGKIVLVRGPWIEAFLDEVCHFPNAAHDDQVDAVSLAVQMLETRKNQIWVF